MCSKYTKWTKLKISSTKKFEKLTHVKIKQHIPKEPIDQEKKITKGIRKYFKMNENKNITY